MTLCELCGLIIQSLPCPCIVKDYIDTNLTGDPHPSEAARLMNLSVHRMRAKFKSVYGMTPRKYIIRARVMLACEMLRTSSEPLSQIAIAAGFASQAHMTRELKRFKNCTPGECRRTAVCQEEDPETISPLIS